MDVVNGGVKFGKGCSINDRKVRVDVKHVWSESTAESIQQKGKGINDPFSSGL